MSEQRRQQVEKLLDEAYQLKDQIEQRLLVESNDPVTVAKLNLDLKNVNEQIAGYIAELEGVKASVGPLLAPNKPLLFVGREDLIRTVKGQLFEGGCAALAALDGKGGVGKTTLALWLAWDAEVLAHFSGGVLWAALGPDADPDYQLRGWLEALGGDPGQASTTTALVAKVKSALQGRPCLLIIDDVWQVEHARLFQAITGPGCAHLLTTRDEALARRFAPKGLSRVEELPEAEAVELLQTLCPAVARADEVALRRMARAVGCLPLALTLIGGYLSDNVSLAAEARQAFERLQAAQTWLGLVDEVERHLNLQQVVELSLQALPSEEYRQAFTGLAPFAPKPASFELAAVQAVTQMDDPGLFGLLVRRNLLEVADGSEERVMVHQVMAATAEKQATQQGRLDELRQGHAQYYLDLAEADTEDWQRIEPEWAQIAYAWEKLSGAEGNEELAMAYIWALTEFQTLRGLWREQISWIERGLVIVRAAGNLHDEGTLLHNMALRYDALGEKGQALDYYEQALPLRRAVGDRKGEASTLNNIGQVYWSLGDNEKALEYYEQDLPLRKAVGDRQGEATTLGCIGLVYSALGDKAKALDYYEQALPLIRAVGDRKGEATTLNNIGMVYDDRGEKAKALAYYEQALPLRRAVGDRSGEAQTLNNIGGVYSDLGDKVKALDYLEQALPLSRAVGDRAGEATTLNNMGWVYWEQGQREKGIALVEQALPLLEAVQSPNAKIAAQTLAQMRQILEQEKSG
jgi:tetratricopeptide (TPR) repeat protein